VHSHCPLQQNAQVSGQVNDRHAPFVDEDFLMEVDTKDPFKLLKVACKALDDYDEKQPEIVPRDIEMQEAADGTRSSKASFPSHCAIPLFCGHGKISTTCIP
jgi:hypothetical protein